MVGIDPRLIAVASISPNFGALVEIEPLLATYGAGAEASIYTDPNGALVMEDHLSRLDAADSLIGAQSRSAALRRALLAALRRALLAAAFNGEVVDQDPNDEPADIALARLRSGTMPARKRTARRSTGAPVKG